MFSFLEEETEDSDAEADRGGAGTDDSDAVLQRALQDAYKQQPTTEDGDLTSISRKRRKVSSSSSDSDVEGEPTSLHLGEEDDNPLKDEGGETDSIRRYATDSKEVTKSNEYHHSRGDDDAEEEASEYPILEIYGQSQTVAGELKRDEERTSGRQHLLLENYEDDDVDDDETEEGQKGDGPSVLPSSPSPLSSNSLQSETLSRLGRVAGLTHIDELPTVAATDLRESNWEYTSSLNESSNVMAEFAKLQRQRHQIGWLAASAMQDADRIAEMSGRMRDAKRNTRAKYGW